MAQYKHGIILATVVFTLVAFIPSAHADPHALAKPPKPPGGALAECQAKVAELEATIEELKAQIATLNASLKYKLPKTGQTFVQYVGDPPYPYPGQDGELQKGMEWPDPRLTDNGNGTVTDNLTNLVWRKNASEFQTSYWNEALSDCYIIMGDGWRLPNRNELLSLINIEKGCPECMGYALPPNHPFVHIWDGHYWTSSTANETAFAWSVYPATGELMQDYKGTALNGVWCVRDAQ